MRLSLRLATAFAGILCAVSAPAQQTRQGGFPHAPDERLLEAVHWVSAYRTEQRSQPMALGRRAPRPQEEAVIGEIQRFFANSSLKAIAVVDGTDVVWKAYKAPAGDDTRLTGYSLGKTITSMVTGKSLCAGKVTMQTTAGSLLPELKGTGYEPVTVADLLTMRSGIKDGSYWAAGTPAARDKIRQIEARQAPWRDMLTVVNQRHANAFSGPVKPGERFEYKEIDPLVLGFMLQEAWGQRLTQVIDKELLEPAGLRGPAELQEGVPGEPYAPTIGRFTLDDWVRFAIWMKGSTQAPGCFGDYVRAATSVQVRTASRDMGGNLFEGYGYLTWIGSSGLRDSFWGWGFGGQKLAMNHRNGRILVVFSSLENNHVEVSALYRKWAQIE